MIVIWIVLAGLAGLVFSSYLYETFVVERRVYAIGGDAANGPVVVHLTDLHGRTRFLNGRVAEIVNQAGPDIVCVTGDLATRRSQLDRVLHELSRIHCPHIYFVPGNYEREEAAFWRKRRFTESEHQAVIKKIRQAGLRVLSNSGESVRIGKRVIRTYGFDNSIYGFEKDDKALPPEDSAFRLLLAHSPDIIRFIREHRIGFDLLLVGHTHGGQIRIAGRTFGSYKHFHTGMKTEPGGGRFYISRGLGTVRLPVRYRCRPEITFFRIGKTRS